jgi:signal peptidase II
MILGVLVGTAGCDQVTKHVARRELGQAGSMVMPGRFVEFTLAENAGAFLSLGASLPPMVRDGFAVCLSVGLLCLLAYLVKAERLPLPAFVGLALIWAGGISNLVDRFSRHGLVTDFMILRAGPVHTGIFNVADLAVVGGVVMVILWLGRKRKGCGAA